MSGLTPTQSRLLSFIVQYQAEYSGVSPSFEEMVQHMGFSSRSQVHRCLSQLEDRGYVRRIPARVRAITVLRTPNGIDLPPRARGRSCGDNIRSVNKPLADSIIHALQTAPDRGEPST